MKTTAQTVKLARKIRAVIFDVDGVVTDNTVSEGNTHKDKRRSYYDGQGISLLRAIGIRIAFITNERGASAKHIVNTIAKWNRLPSSSLKISDGGWEHIKLYTNSGGPKKISVAKKWLNKIGLTFEECAFMGDDLVDLPLLQVVALRAVPISAETCIKTIADFVSDRPGGYGAIRDFANFILEARGIDPRNLPTE